MPHYLQELHFYHNFIVVLIKDFLLILSFVLECIYWASLICLVLKDRREIQRGAWLDSVLRGNPCKPKPMVECDMYFDMGICRFRRLRRRHISRSVDLSVHKSVCCLGSGHIYKHILSSCNNSHPPPSKKKKKLLPLTSWSSPPAPTTWGLCNHSFQPSLVATPDFRMGQALLSTLCYWTFEGFTASVYQEIDIIMEVITEQSLTKLVNVVKSVEVKESQEGWCPRQREERRGIAVYGWEMGWCFLWTVRL